MTVAKVYTFAVTVRSGSRPHPTADIGAGLTVPAWSESFTANVEADDLEAARKAAITRGHDEAPGFIREWERRWDEEADVHWRNSPPESLDDVTVDVTFKDLVVGASVGAR